jgi:hypothetical protein
MLVSTKYLDGRYVTVLSQGFIWYKGSKLGVFGFCSKSYQFFF